MRNPLDIFTRRWRKEQDAMVYAPPPSAPSLRLGRSDRPTVFNPKMKYGRTPLEIERSKERRQKNRARRISLALHGRRRRPHGRPRNVARR